MQAIFLMLPVSKVYFQLICLNLYARYETKTLWIGFVRHLTPSGPYWASAFTYHFEINCPVICTSTQRHLPFCCDISHYLVSFSIKIENRSPTSCPSVLVF